MQWHAGSDRPSRRPRGRIVSSVVAALALASCGDDRPSLPEWTSTWETRKAMVPTADELLAGGTALCDELVGRYREELSDLVPTPTEGLDSAVDDWRSHAETIVFECSDDPDELDAQMSELGVLTAEVDAGLDAELDG